MIDPPTTLEMLMKNEAPKPVVVDSGTSMSPPREIAEAAKKPDIASEPQQEELEETDQSLDDGRVSPRSLYDQFRTEMNLLSAIEESHAQLAALEQTRNVGQAQQETVVLAQAWDQNQQLEAVRLQSFQQTEISLKKKEEKVEELKAHLSDLKSELAKARRRETPIQTDKLPPATHSQATQAKAMGSARCLLIPTQAVFP